MNDASQGILQNICAEGPLESNQAMTFENFPMYTFVLMSPKLLEVSKVFVPASGICDEVEFFPANACDDRIVNYAACARMEEAGEG